MAPRLGWQLGINRPYPSIALMAQSTADYQQRQVSTRMLYDGTGNWVDPYTSPATALSTLFPGPAASSSSGPDKVGFIRQQVANQRNADLTPLQGRLSPEARQQLQHFTTRWTQDQ